MSVADAVVLAEAVAAVVRGSVGVESVHVLAAGNVTAGSALVAAGEPWMDRRTNDTFCPGGRISLEVTFIEATADPISAITRAAERVDLLVAAVAADPTLGGLVDLFDVERVAAPALVRTTSGELIGVRVVLAPMTHQEQP